MEIKSHRVITMLQQFKCLIIRYMTNKKCYGNDSELLLVLSVNRIIIWLDGVSKFDQLPPSGVNYCMPMPIRRGAI
jgi:hypothetical protein